MQTACVTNCLPFVFDEGAEVKPQHGPHQCDQWVWSDWPTGHIYGCGRLIRNYFPGLERQGLRTAADQHWTPVPGSNRWQLVTDSDTAIGLERPIYLMASPGARDSQYFSARTLVEDSAGAKTIHFITASLAGEERDQSHFTRESFVFEGEFNEVEWLKLWQ